MSDLIRTNKPEESLTQRLRAKIAGGKQTTRNTCLLLDISGSMDGDPIRQLGKLAEDLKRFRRFTFSDRCREIPPTERVGGVEGGTNMGGAFDHIRKQGIVNCVIITDGHPDDPNYALSAAAGLKVDIIYVGPPPAPPFLEKLAQSTGGKYGEATLEHLKELESKVVALLPAPSEAIQL